MTEFGIYDDQAADYSADEALEAQMYSREEAERRLVEVRDEYGENAYVHEVEDADD